jgi:hypothetical protein
VKRIAAVAALIVALLAVPAAAMASTGSAGSNHPGPWGPSFCGAGQFHHGHFRGRHGNHHNRHHGRHHQFSNCFFPPAPPSGLCNGATFTFSWGHGASSLFEESGPTLYSGESFSFNGSIYTIGTANPTAGSMTLTVVNYGPSIFYGVGTICSSYG